MGYLFENMEKMNIQEERKLRAEAEKRFEDAEKMFDEKLKLATEQVAEKTAIQSIIESYQELGMSKEITQNKLMQKFNLTESEANEKLEQFWN